MSAHHASTLRVERTPRRGASRLLGDSQLPSIFTSPACQKSNKVEYSLEAYQKQSLNMAGMEQLNPIDPWAAPTTKVFAFIGVAYVSYKIFSFWRLIASLFILPGQSVCHT